MKMLERIVGKNFVLRRQRMSDAEDFWRMAQDKEIARWTRIQHPFTKKQAREQMKRSIKQWKEGISYRYFIEYQGNLAGWVGLAIDKRDNRAELHYSIAKEYRGKGIASGASKLILQQGFKRLKLNKIYANFIQGNTASRHVMEKLGMKYECRLRQNTKKGSKYHDAIQYYVLKRQYTM